MSKKRPKKKYDPLAKQRDMAHEVASRYTIAGISDLKGAVYIFNDDLKPVHISKSTAAMINKVKHHWSVCACVAGRYKNGKVWVRYIQESANMQATAEELSPLVTEFVEDFFHAQDEDTRLCKWWLARPRLDNVFTAEQVITPAYLADIFRCFITKNEEAAGVEYGNCPPESSKDFSILDFNEWWKLNRSPRSQLQRLWLED